MSPQHGPSFGVDLITFFDHAYWGAGSSAEFASMMDDDPRVFWDRVLPALAKAGTTVIETTFAPASLESAYAAYGDAAGVRAAFAAHDVRVVSEYFGDFERAKSLTPVTIGRLVESARDMASRLAEQGGRFLVVGLPMRRNADHGGYDPIDLAYAEAIAGALHIIAAATAEAGIKVLLHPESHSSMWTSRDVDLFMALTDPFFVGLCPDTGHLVLGGADPVAVTRRHLDRVELLHWKDAAGPFTEKVTVDDGIFQEHQRYFRPMGRGIVDWAALIELLAPVGKLDTVLLELDATPGPVDQLLDAQQFLRSRIADVAPKKLS